MMAFYTYDEEAEALYVLLRTEEEAAIAETVELGETLHVDLDDGGRVVGIEILYPGRADTDLEPLKARFGIELRLPFTFAA